MCTFNNKPFSIVHLCGFKQYDIRIASWSFTTIKHITWQKWKIHKGFFFSIFPDILSYIQSITRKEQQNFLSPKSFLSGKEIHEITSEEYNDPCIKSSLLHNWFNIRGRVNCFLKQEPPELKGLNYLHFKYMCPYNLIIPWKWLYHL